MARSFNGSADYLENGIAPVSAYAYTLASWFNSASLALSGDAIWVGNSSDSDRYISLLVDTSGQVRLGMRQDSTAESYAYGSGTVSAGTWNHACGVGVGLTERYAYLNGSVGSIDSASRVFSSGYNRVSIGREGDSTPSRYFNGSLAESAIWDTNLSDAEVSALASGMCPLLVRPEALVFYAPLHGRGGAGSNEFDWVGGLTLTASGSPGVTDHPRIIYPRRRTSIWVPPVSSGAPSITALSAINITATSAQPRISYS